MKLGTGEDVPLDFFLPKELPISHTIENDVTVLGDQVVVVEPQAASVSPDSDSSITNINIDSVESELDRAFNELKMKIVARIPEDPVAYKKSIESFSKSVSRLPAKTDAVLQKTLHSFGKTLSVVMPILFV